MAQNTSIIHLTTVKDSAPAQCHLMPCRIEHKELPIKAAEYFYPTIRQLESGGDDDQGRSKESHNSKEENSTANPILAASFRGRPLHGRKVAFPDGNQAHVVGKDPRSTSVPTKQFREFTYWNWDALPTSDDEVMKALQWLTISKAIHDD